MESLRFSLRHAARSLRHAPGFTLVVVLALGLGIGATTALFSVVHSVLQRPLPFPQPDRIVQLWQLGKDGGEMNFSDPNFADLREQSRSFAAMAELQAGDAVTVNGGGEPLRAHPASVSRDFFAVLGVKPALGRLFAPEEQREGGPGAVVVSHAFWLRALGGTADLASRQLRFGGRLYRVVGVLPDGAAFPAGTDLWEPREAYPLFPSRTAHNFQALGRLREGVPVERAQQEASAIARRLKAVHGEDTWMSNAAVVPLQEQIVGRVRPALMLLLGAAAFLLLIACANVSNLLLVRTAGRSHETAVRLALGAGRVRLVQQFVAEALLLSLAGGAVGLAVAWWGVRVLRRMQPEGLPRVADVEVSGGVFLFALAVSLVTAVALGALTALHALRGELRERMARGRTVSGGAGRMRDGLAALQVALTLVLLVGAGVLGRSFLRLLSADTGYRTSGGVVLDLAMDDPADAAGGVRLAAFQDELMGRLRAIPGVTEVGGVNAFPLDGGYSDGTFLELMRPDEATSFEDFQRLAADPARTGQAEYRVASDGYFRAMGIPLRRGRWFQPGDGPTSGHVALVSESLARKRWPGQDPVGKIIQFGNMDGDLHPFTVVGVVGDIREASVDAEPRPTLYGSARQRTGKISRFHVVMRGPVDAAAMIAPARRILRELAPEVPPTFRTLDEVFSASLADRRFSLLLLGAFGGAALLLAVLGIYGVISYLVAQRTREIGIRLAFGARAGDVSRLVVGHGAALAGTGIAAGLVAAFVLHRVLGGFMYGVSAVDPVAYAGVAVLLALVALAASALPARRATRVDPMIALRAD
jgi:predicted permease